MFKPCLKGLEVSGLRTCRSVFGFRDDHPAVRGDDGDEEGVLSSVTSREHRLWSRSLLHSMLGWRWRWAEVPLCRTLRSSLDSEFPSIKPASSARSKPSLASQVTHDYSSKRRRIVGMPKCRHRCLSRIQPFREARCFGAASPGHPVHPGAEKGDSIRTPLTHPHIDKLPWWTRGSGMMG